MLGGGPYQYSKCPKCGELMCNGRCENSDCEYHWHPLAENISCSPDCENLKEDGTKSEEGCRASGCKAYVTE